MPREVSRSLHSQVNVIHLLCDPRRSLDRLRLHLGHLAGVVVVGLAVVARVFLDRCGLRRGLEGGFVRDTLEVGPSAGGVVLHLLVVPDLVLEDAVVDLPAQALHAFKLLPCDAVFGDAQALSARATS